MSQNQALELVRQFISDKGLNPPKFYFINHRPEGWAVTTHLYLRLLVDDQTGQITFRGNGD